MLLLEDWDSRQSGELSPPKASRTLASFFCNCCSESLVELSPSSRMRSSRLAAAEKCASACRTEERGGAKMKIWIEEENTGGVASLIKQEEEHMRRVDGWN